MNLFRITLITFLFSQFVLAQQPISLGTPGNTSSSGNSGAAAAPAPVVQTGKFCPFNVTLDGYIDNGNLQEIGQLATNLKNSNTENSQMCQMVGTNIGALLQMIEPEKFLPPTEPTATTGGGGQTPKPPETCITNPARCADLLTTLMAAYKDGKCSGNADAIANSLVALAVKIGGSAGAEGATAAISAQVLMEVYNIAKARSGAIGAANKLNKNQMEQMRDNIKGLMACMANDTYDSTICRSVEYNKIASLIKNPSKDNPPATDKPRLSRSNLKIVYTCIQEGKNLADCIKGIKTEKVEAKDSKDGKELVSRQVTEDDFVHDRKLLNMTAVAAGKITDGQLVTFIKTAELYHEKELKDLGLKYNDLQRRKKDYNTNAYGGHHSLLIKHCFYNYVPAHTEEKDVHYFTTSTRQWDHMYCPRLNACLTKINAADPSKALTTFDIFTGGKKAASDETACSGIGKLDQLDETYMLDQLNAVKFNPTLSTNGCAVAEATNAGKKESSTNKD